MAIEPYTQKIGVKAGRGVINPDFARVLDDGGTFQKLGRGLMELSEPRLRAEAEKQATIDVGKAQIAKDADGNFVKPLPPPGGGTRYTAVFDKLLGDRYVDTVYRAQEPEFNRIYADNARDPEAAKAAADGRVDGVLKGVPPELRPALEGILRREVNERDRGLVQRKTAEDQQAQVNGLRSIIGADSDAANAILATGGAEAQTRAQFHIDRAKSNLALLVELGELDPNGVTAGTLKLTLTAEEAARVGASITASAEISKGLTTLPVEEQETLALFSLGVDNGKKAAGKNFAQFIAALPDEATRRRLGSTAANLASQTRQEQNRIASEAAQVAQDQENARLLQQAISNVMSGNTTHDDKTKLAIDDAFFRGNGSRPIREVMSTAQGRWNAIQTLVQTGHFPSGAAEYLETQIYSEDPAPVLELVKNLNMVRDRFGISKGLMVTNRLSSRTRAVIDYIATEQRTGQSPTELSRRLSQSLRGQERELSSISALYIDPDTKRNNYEDRRAAMLAKSIGFDPKVAIPKAVRDDYDRLLIHNYDIHDQNLEKATAATARQVANGWAALPFIYSGIGPRTWAAKGITVADLDQIFGMSQGFSFGNKSGSGRYARLQPIDDVVETGVNGPMFGRYNVILFSADGRTQRSFERDVDDLIDKWRAKKTSRSFAPEVVAAQEKERRMRARETNIRPRRGSDY
jgi:hypothetical protein